MTTPSAHSTYIAPPAIIEHEATALVGIGDIYATLRDKKCWDNYSQALAIARQFNLPLVQANALNREGLVQLAVEQNQKALDSFNQALPLYRRLNMNDAAGLTLNNIGLAWSGLGEMANPSTSSTRLCPSWSPPVTKMVRASPSAIWD